MSVAFICLEFGLTSGMKTYAGGLGILAGDIMKSATDLEMGYYGVGLLYTKGYLKQSISPATGEQLESPDPWNPSKYLSLTDTTFVLQIQEREIHVRVWQYSVHGESGSQSLVYFLDTDFEENDDYDRQICHTLYAEDSTIRLLQELLLGFGSVELMKSLELFDTTHKIHLNESNVAFVIPALHEKYGMSVKDKIVFTTHTPIRAGHKIYEKQFLIDRVHPSLIQKIDTVIGDYPLNLTEFCLSWSGYSNGVSRKHSIVTKDMYPGSDIDYVTNGVHHLTWTTPETQLLFDTNIPQWRRNPFELHNALQITDEEIFTSHRHNKQKLFESIYYDLDIRLNESIFTIGFARRADGYKRHDFLLYNLDWLRSIADRFDGIQIIYSGKAYFAGGGIDSSIAHINRVIHQDLGPKIKVVFIPDYSMDVSLKMVSGVDIWLNNPQKPLEACGTSGMKAALNGVPNFSVLDGWWAEGWIENETGWSIGDTDRESIKQLLSEHDEQANMYNKLNDLILPKYYYDTKDWYRIMKQAIAINGSYFHGTRMMEEYSAKAYQI
jgi:glycogen phosphorylase